jgi:uncharacterized protein YndB with AHSA1/START domain
MSNSMIIKETVKFKSDAKIVWDLVINPEMTKQYMFGCEVLSDWQVGNSIIWKGKTEDGKEVIYVKGSILEFEEGRKTTFSMFDPNMGIADIPTNYVNLTYEVIPKDSGCDLVITQGDFQSTDNAEKRFEESKQGWQMVIPTMKKLLNE